MFSQMSRHEPLSFPYARAVPDGDRSEKAESYSGIFRPCSECRTAEYLLFRTRNNSHFQCLAGLSYSLSENNSVTLSYAASFFAEMQ